MGGGKKTTLKLGYLKESSPRKKEKYNRRGRAYNVCSPPIQVW